MKTLAAGIAVAALALAGCGGGGNGGSQRLSKADFQAKANAICSKYNAKVKGVMANVQNNPASLANGIQKALGYVKKGTTELDALKPPQQYDAKYKEFSRINHQQITSAQQLVQAARAKNRAQLRSTITSLESEGKDSDRVARQLGLSTCAQG